MNGMLYVIAALTVTTITPCLCMNNTTASNASIADNRTTLYIGALFNLDVNPDWGVLPMAQQAVEEVNSNPHILPGYRLQLVLNSTQGHLGFGQHVFQDYLNTGPRKIMLLGPADDAMAKSIASYAALPHVRLMQFSYGTSDLDLANRRDLYPYFFRTAPSLASYDEPRIAMLKYYNWNEVGIVYGDSLLYMQLANQFKARLQNNGITVLAEVRLQSNDPTRAVRTMKDRDVHVIFGMFKHGVKARKLFCSAYRNGMYGPHYVWIMLKSYNLGWWLPGSAKSLGCDKIEMKCQIQNHFSFMGPGNLKNSEIIAHAQKNVSTILSDYYARVDSNTSTANRSDYALNVYDAVWSIAMVLDKSRGKLQSLKKSLKNFTYGDPEVVEVFYNETLKLNFPSPNRENVKYFHNGNRYVDVKVKQLYLADGWMRAQSAGTFVKSTFTPSKDIRWFAGVPYRKTDEEYTYRTIDADLFLALLIMASMGLLYALVCYVSVAVYMRRKRVLLHSGGIVSLLIILGCMLNYITVILYGFDYSSVAPETVTKLCRARAWTFSLGFSLSVGGLVAKLWIAYTVLSKRTLMTKRRRLLWMLFLILLLVIFDVIFLTSWEVTDPLYRKLKIVKSQPQYECFEPITADTFKVTNTVVETCTCTNLALWLSILLVLKIFVLLFGAFLARQTRKIYIPSLDDTRRCGVCVFVACIFCVAGIIAAFSSQLYPSVFYGFIGFFIIIVTTFILGLLFTYMVIQLFCNPKPGHVICQCCVPCCDNLSIICAKSCRCSPCCETCCVTCWSWLGRCAFACCGRPNDPLGGQQDSKLQYVIVGQPFDRDAHITYLQNTIKERDEELEKLRQKRNAVVSAETQTWDSSDDDDKSDDNDQDEHDETEEGNQDGGVGRAAATKKNNKKRKKFKNAARKIKIFNQKLDFSHVQSKVDSNLQPGQKSPRASVSMSSGEDLYPLYGRRGSRAVNVEVDEEVTRLKSLLLEKDDEIRRLKKDIAGSDAMKERRKSSIRPKPETRRSVKISIQENNTNVPNKERNSMRNSVPKRPSVLTVPSQPSVVITNQNGTDTTKPKQTGDNSTSISPPQTPEAALEGMGHIPEESDETAAKSSQDSIANSEGRKNSLITPAAYWLLGTPEDQAVLKDDKDKELTEENELADASSVKKAGEAVIVDETLKSEQQSVKLENEADKENLNEEAKETEIAQQADKDDQHWKNEGNELNAGEMPNDKGKACGDYLLEPTGIEAAAAEQSTEATEATQEKNVNPDREETDMDVAGSRKNTPADKVSEAALLAAQHSGSEADENKQKQSKEESKPKANEDKENDKANKENAKPAEDSDGEFDVIDDSNTNNNNKRDTNGSSGHKDKTKDNSNTDNESEAGSSGKNTYTSGMFEIDEDKERKGEGIVGLGDSSVNPTKNGNGKRTTAARARARPRPMKRWSKVRWAATAKVDTGGSRSNPYRTSIKSYKPRDYSRVRSRLFESNSYGRKETKDRNPTTNDDENQTEERRDLKRPIRVRSKGVMPTVDHSKVQSRFSRNSENAWKRDPAIPVKPQVRGKQSYSSIHLSR